MKNKYKLPGQDETINSFNELIKSGETIIKNRHAQVLGKLGGLATKKKYGKAHYKRLAENMNRKKKAKLNYLEEK